MNIFCFNYLAIDSYCPLQQPTQEKIRYTNLVMFTPLRVLQARLRMRENQFSSPFTQEGCHNRRTLPPLEFAWSDP